MDNYFVQMEIEPANLVSCYLDGMEPDPVAFIAEIWPNMGVNGDVN